MKRRDLVLSVVGLCGEREEFGRTSLQKVTYFAAAALDQPLGYRAYYYGPFSDVVEAEVEALVLAGLIEERVEALGFVGRGGFDARKYEYRATKEGFERIKEIKRIHGAEHAVLSDLVGAIEKAVGGFDQRILSAAAKTHFIMCRERRSLPPDEIRSVGKALGWSLSETQIERVLSLLNDLSLAS